MTLVVVEEARKPDLWIVGAAWLISFDGARAERQQRGECGQHDKRSHCADLHCFIVRFGLPPKRLSLAMMNSTSVACADRKSTRLNSSHYCAHRMHSSA